MTAYRPNGYTGHIDTFARSCLPPVEEWPQLVFSLPELCYPERLNAGRVLLDDAIKEGYGERPALYSDTERWSYVELLARANRIANVLVRDYGLVAGNRVLLRGANSPMLAAAWLACLRAGGIAVTTMPMLRAKELSEIAHKARVDHVISDARLLADVQTAAVATGRLKHVLAYGDRSFELRLARHSPAFQPVDTACDDVALLAFTSGTTGDPKATMHFHRDVLVMADIVGRYLLETSPEDIYIGSPPLGFTFGLGALLVFPLRFRASAVLLEGTPPDAMLAAITKFRATCLFTSPTMYRNLTPRVGQTDLSSLKRAVSAGEPLPQATSDAWHTVTGLRLIDGLGTTEMIHMFISAKGAEIRPGATGRPLPGYEVVIFDDDGKPLSPGKSGHLAVRGPTGCRYLDDPRQRDYVQNGWNITGDLCRLDEDGYFWFQGRADDMIISAGYNIAGPEVENALLAHPAVQECAVIGEPNSERGQLVKAFIVLNPDFEAGPALAEALQKHVKASIAPYKYPRAIQFVDALPKTQTGKVQRFVLRDRGIAAATSSSAKPDGK
jgi:2-aminobenzoate-CoA ligase